MSRTPVKSALTKLELENFVKCFDGIGTMVTGLSMRDLEDIYEVRVSLEVLALKKSIDIINRKDLKLMKLELSGILESYKNGKAPDIDYINSVDERFHNLIVDNTPNKYVKTLMNSIKNKIAYYRREAYVLTDTGRESADYHYRILEAIEENNFELASNLLQEHINWSFNILLGALPKIQGVGK